MTETIPSSINLAALSEILLYGSLHEDNLIMPASYDQRIKTAENALLQQLDSMRMPSPLDDDVRDAVLQHLTTVSLVYFELGMKAGAALFGGLQGELPVDLKAGIDKVVWEIA